MKPPHPPSTPAEPSGALAEAGPRLLTLPQAARYLGLSPWTVLLQRTAVP